MFKSTYRTKLQTFLSESGNLSSAQLKLRQLHSIKSFADTLILDDNNAEVVWVYNTQCKKKKGFLKIEKETNAIVLDNDNNIVSCAFPRFRGLFDSRASQIHWESATGEQKLDGKLVMIYNHRGNTFIQTRESATASNIIPGTNETYSQAVRAVLTKKFGNPFSPFNTNKYSADLVWLFEFVSPKNNTVTMYEEDGLALLSVIKKSLGQTELKRHLAENFADDYNFTIPYRFAIRSEEEAIDLHNELNDPIGPGIVITDKRGKRVSLVSDVFKTIEKLTNPVVSEKQIATVALTGYAELLSNRFKSFADLLLLFDTTIHEIIDDLDNIWSFNKDILSRKVFAERIDDTENGEMKRILFKMRSGKVENFSDVLACLCSETLIEETKRRHRLSYNKIHREFKKFKEVSSNVR